MNSFRNNYYFIPIGVIFGYLNIIEFVAKKYFIIFLNKFCYMLETPKVLNTSIIFIFTV